MLSNFLRKLIFARQFVMANGKVEILGDGYVLLAAPLLTRLQRNEDLGEAIRAQTSIVAKRLGVLKPADFIKYLKDIFETMGFGSLEVIDIDVGKKRAILRLRESTLARAARAGAPAVPQPSCAIAGQVLAGMLTFVFGKKVVAEERDCLAAGKEYCQFVVK